MDLYLVRHGDTELGPDGLYPDPAHLSDLGRSQARALEPRLAAISPDVLITSGLERADETAEPFVVSSGMEPIKVPEFDEIGIGDLRSRDLSVVKEKLFADPFVPDFSDYGGESSTDFERRVLGSLHERVIDRFAGSERVALVVHGGPINVILDWIEHGGFTGRFTRAIGTASITMLRSENDGFLINYVSDTSHLEGVG